MLLYGFNVPECISNREISSSSMSRREGILDEAETASDWGELPVELLAFRPAANAYDKGDSESIATTANGTTAAVS